MRARQEKHCERRMKKKTVDKKMKRKEERTEKKSNTCTNMIDRPMRVNALVRAQSYRKYGKKKTTREKREATTHRPNFVHLRLPRHHHYYLYRQHYGGQFRLRSYKNDSQKWPCRWPNGICLAASSSRSSRWAHSTSCT